MRFPMCTGLSALALAGRTRYASPKPAEDQMELKIETREAHGVTIVSCHGRIMFGEEATALRARLKEILDSKRQIVLNLSDVSYIDSGGLGMLVGVYSSARAAGADIKLSGLGQRLRDVLQVTKLVTVFEAYDSEQQAITAFQKRAS
jgi:anti-sigma B factor antagonist